MASLPQCNMQSFVDTVSESHSSSIVRLGLERNRTRSKRYVKETACVIVCTILFLSNCYSVAGGGVMQSIQEPPPPLAADASLSALQAQMAVENLCVASSNLLEHIRTLRLSILLMDEETIAAEEEWQVRESFKVTQEASLEAAKLEVELWKLQNRNDVS